MADQNVKFVRINGRVVPIKQKPGQSMKGAQMDAVMNDIARYGRPNAGRKKSSGTSSVGKNPSLPKSAKKPKGASEHLQLGTRAAFAGIAGGLAANAAAFGRNKIALGFGAVAIGTGLYNEYRNVKNSFEHGDKKNSFWHGVGRYATNSLAIGAGAITGNLAVRNLATLAARRKIRVP